MDVGQDSAGAAASAKPRRLPPTAFRTPRAVEGNGPYQIQRTLSRNDAVEFCPEEHFSKQGGTRCPQRVEGLSLRGKRLEGKPLHLRLHPAKAVEGNGPDQFVVIGRTPIPLLFLHRRQPEEQHIVRFNPRGVGLARVTRGFFRPDVVHQELTLNRPELIPLHREIRRG